MRSVSAQRLRRLRLVLTLLFTTLNAAGLILLAWLVVRSDSLHGEQLLDGDLHRVTSTAARLVQYGDAIVTDYIGRDVLGDQCPQFAVLPGGATPFAPYYSARNCVEVNRADLDVLATQTVSSNLVLETYINDGDVRVRTEPLRNEFAQNIGAVVAWSDARGVAAEHQRLVLSVAGGCLVLVAAVALAGHALAGRALRPAAAALEQQELLLAETAHDLRTPVAALRALAETALRHPDQRAELLPRTVRLAGRMGGIIDGLLVRARLAAGVEQLAIQPVWLDQLVTSLVEETPHDGARVTVTAAATKVSADPALLQRAIGNLLDNALRYGKQPDQPAIVHITVAGGRVTVADHGPGIDASLAEDAFDRFTGAGGSSGLGLAIVSWVAQSHGGTLSVYNAEEGGAIFELALPVLRD
ncbi:two-component sensor histidine kinase [Amycolatopsis albispora]|uniref:histidine kinase n=1 Tax=Amycolatopsis albispora TaxID=1804986 RepID=A0A344LHC7_9PSEU|nr:HAMP domain-containing sensor histidine kinase [Amycolatopsis albispora]AXB47451.1 two-component sensor histidine kinase [Amycolatopsis albispora]